MERYWPNLCFFLFWNKSLVFVLLRLIHRITSNFLWSVSLFANTFTDKVLFYFEFLSPKQLIILTYCQGLNGRFSSDDRSWILQERTSLHGFIIKTNLYLFHFIYHDFFVLKFSHKYFYTERGRVVKEEFKEQFS